MTQKLAVTMNEDEISYFKKFMTEEFSKEGKFVEWGSGGSTEMFLEFMTEGRSMISIEHNEAWYDKVTEAIKDHPNRDRLTYLYIPPKMPLTFYGYGVPTEESPTYNTEYINPEKAFDDIKIWDADVFLVDGISRGACLATTVSKISPAGAIPHTIFLHDYVGREEWYDWAVDLATTKEVVGSTLVRMTH